MVSKTLLTAELGLAVRRPHVVALAVLVALGPLNALLLPRFPPSIERFFAQVFQLDGWVEIVLVNDHLAIYAVLYWLGLFDVLRAVVVPTEEGYLDILLSKPLTRSRYLVAKLTPAFVVLLLLGVTAGLAHGASARLVGPFDVARFAAGVATTIALTLMLLALTAMVTLFVRESYHAVVVGFGIWLSSMLGGSVFMYRPDVLAPHPAVRAIVAYPMNLVWASSGEVTTTWLIALMGIALTAATVGLAGVLFSRRDMV